MHTNVYRCVRMWILNATQVTVTILFFFVHWSGVNIVWRLLLKACNFPFSLAYYKQTKNTQMLFQIPLWLDLKWNYALVDFDLISNKPVKILSMHVLVLGNVIWFRYNFFSSLVSSHVCIWMVPLSFGQLNLNSTRTIWVLTLGSDDNCGTPMQMLNSNWLYKNSHNQTDDETGKNEGINWIESVDWFALN